MTSEQMHILRHSLGIRDDWSGNEYRNYYATEQNCPELEALVMTGDMRRGNIIPGGLQCYHVTEIGRAKVLSARRDVDEEMSKLSKSQRKYRAFLRADSGLSFIEWLTSDSYADLRRRC